ncbi:hypothetical protein SAMN04487981_12949 [Streptomyces sp. cf386]|nr:hypothetical protein SAMN04487981_12949 [Streptomyces sp. cf386]
MHRFPRGPWVCPKRGQFSPAAVAVSQSAASASVRRRACVWWALPSWTTWTRPWFAVLRGGLRHLARYWETFRQKGQFPGSAGVGEFFDLVGETVVGVVELGAGDFVDLEAFDRFAQGLGVAA